MDSYLRYFQYSPVFRSSFVVFVAFLSASGSGLHLNLCILYYMNLFMYLCIYVYIYLFGYVFLENSW
jgi:hypothetical protein